MSRRLNGSSVGRLIVSVPFTVVADFFSLVGGRRGSVFILLAGAVPSS